MRTILVVEDEPVLSDLIREVLEGVGYRCRAARLGSEADRMLRETPFDAAVVDRGLPDGDGLGWLESLAVLRPDLASRSLLITGSMIEPEDSRRIDRCGAMVLFKPFRVEQLVQALEARLTAEPEGRPRRATGERSPEPETGRDDVNSKEP